MVWSAVLPRWVGVNTTVVVYVILLSPHFLWQSEAAATAGATSTFVGFYCCGEEAIAIERALVAFARDRQVRARATDGERKSGRTRNNLRIKDSGFASMTLLSPHLACLPACLPASALCLLPRLPTSCPVFLTWSMARACRICQVWVHSPVTRGELCCFLCSGGQMKSQLELTTGMRGHIFSTDLHLTVCFFLHWP